MATATEVTAYKLSHPGVSGAEAKKAIDLSASTASNTSAIDGLDRAVADYNASPSTVTADALNSAIQVASALKIAGTSSALSSTQGRNTVDTFAIDSALKAAQPSLDQAVAAGLTSVSGGGFFDALGTFATNIAAPLAVGGAAIATGIPALTAGLGALGVTGATAAGAGSSAAGAAGTLGGLATLPSVPAGLSTSGLPSIGSTIAGSTSAAIAPELASLAAPIAGTAGLGAAGTAASTGSGILDMAQNSSTSTLGQIASGIGGVVSSTQAADAINSAASVQEQAALAAIAEQQRQFDLTRQDLAPFQEAGVSAVSQQQALLGLGTPEEQAAAFAAFADTPGQQFLRDEQERALLRNASAVGGLGGGNVLKALQENAFNVASTDFNNNFNQLSSLTGGGQVAATNLGTIGSTTSSNISSLLSDQGAALASGILGTQQAEAQGIGNLISLGTEMFGFF